MSLPIDSTLLPFFEPQGIVLVGASRNPMKLGFGLARNLVQSGYDGAIHFVNPGGGTLLERPLHPTIAHVPDPVDLAVLLVPAPAMPQAIAECGERGIRAAILAFINQKHSLLISAHDALLPSVNGRLRSVV